MISTGSALRRSNCTKIAALYFGCDRWQRFYRTQILIERPIEWLCDSLNEPSLS